MRILRLSELFRGISASKRTTGGRRKSLGGFLAHTGGAVALIFGLTVIPLIGFAGGAIDYANAYRMRSKLQDALDAAALAAGREIDMGGSVGDAKASANQVLEANLGADVPPYTKTFDIDASAGTVVASAQMHVDTYLLGVLGQTYFDVEVESTVRLPRGKVEVALVLDNSGSMAGSKIRDLRDAATRLTEVLFLNSRGEDWVKIGLVPFAGSVNIGSGNANKLWMDTEGRSSAHYENLDIDASSGVTRFDLYEQMSTNWAGCVEVRPSPYDVTDAPPEPAYDDTYFVPMFAPDEPDPPEGSWGWGWKYDNTYLRDDGGDCHGGGPGSDGYRNDAEELEAQQRSCKYNGQRPSGGGPNFLCDTQEVLELTHEQSRVTDAIDAMRANGLTNIHEGVMWGWRVLSPGEPFTGGKPYEDNDNTKVMIVMTDGENTHSGNDGWGSTQNMSNYSPYGYAKNGRLRPATGTDRLLVEAMNSKTATACANAKAKDIVIYTIAVGVHDPDTLDMLARCATTRSRSFAIENADTLTSVFEAIAGEINKLRIAS